MIPSLVTKGDGGGVESVIDAVEAVVNGEVCRMTPLIRIPIRMGQTGLVIRPGASGRLRRCPVPVDGRLLGRPCRHTASARWCGAVLSLVG